MTGHMEATINHYKTKSEGTTKYSEIVLRYVIDYDVWKKTFAEYLERYDEEKTQ